MELWPFSVTSSLRWPHSFSHSPLPLHFTTLDGTLAALALWEVNSPFHCPRGAQRRESPLPVGSRASKRRRGKVLLFQRSSRPETQSSTNRPTRFLLRKLDWRRSKRS
ncbi:hypothetical protein Cni_G22473 [Canna indica]|uniref:Uncharacterized protein n=1 Tax=Canna indica TaxID=4628 RepID=A0AAQ3KY05_9LILI|nr:hypothetical protein Cni_G22473 [Canna indica]